MLYQTEIVTEQGRMIIIADNHALYLLEFINRKGLAAEIDRLALQTERSIVEGRTTITDQTQEELTYYFQGRLKAFTVPVVFVGSEFQKKVWQELMRIPLGHAVSYKTIACALQKPKGYRAVARANATNQLALIVPCHRVITAQGSCGGYAAGIERKQWLLAHERQMVSCE